MFPNKIRAPRVRESIDFCHDCIKVPHVAPEDKFANAITKLKQEVAATPSLSSSHQLIAIKQLQSIFSKHKDKETSINNNVDVPGTINGTSIDSLPYQHNDPVKLSHPLTPKKKVFDSNKNLASFPRIFVVSKTFLPQIIREPFQSQVLAPIAYLTRSRTPASCETLSEDELGLLP